MIRSRRAFTASTLLLLFPALAFLPSAGAQTPATGGLGTGVGGGAAPGGNAPGANAPAPGVAGGLATPPPNRPLTLADVVARAVGGNSGLVTARQRLQKAQELITQVNAQGRPQFRADAADTYTSYSAFAPTLPNPTVTNPTLPGGGQIPVVVDQGNGFSTSFIGGGGGGNAPASGFAPATTSLGASPGVGGPVAAPGTGTAPGGSLGSGPGQGSGPGTLGGTSPGGTIAPGGTGSPGATPPAAPNPGIGAPGGTNGGTAAPGTTAPAAPGGTAAPGSAPGSAVPSTPVPTGTPGGAAPSGQGAGLPSVVAGYLTDLGPAPADRAEQTASAATLTARAEENARAKPQDTTTGGGSGGGTTNPVTGSGAAGIRGERNNYAARVSVSQYIDLFGLLPAARDAQKDVRDFYSLDIERLQNETALAAKNLFFNLLLGQEQVTTQEEQVRYAQENVRITEARLRQGIVSRFDVLTAQTALSAAQQQLIAAQDQRDLAQANLSYLLGTDPDQALTLQTPPLPQGQAIDLKQTTQAALVRRPEVRQAGVNVSEARRLVKLAGSTLLPTLGLVASGEQAGIASQTTPRSYASLTAQLAVPLDDGGATRSRVRSARLDVDTQTLTLEQVKLNVSLEVRQATLNIRSAQAQVGAAQTGVTQGQEAVRLAYLRYQGGLGTFLDVLNALAQLARTRTNLSNAEFFYQTSLAQLVRATGGR